MAQNAFLQSACLLLFFSLLTIRLSFSQQVCESQLNDLIQQQLQASNATQGSEWVCPGKEERKEETQLETQRQKKRGPIGVYLVIL